jgi:hypothetical protein
MALFFVHAVQQGHPRSVFHNQPPPGTVPSIDAKLLSQPLQEWHSMRKTPLVAEVSTRNEYRVLVWMLQAVAGEQSQRVTAYCTVPSPMVTTTGALIVAVAGMV